MRITRSEYSRISTPAEYRLHLSRMHRPVSAIPHAPASSARICHEDPCRFWMCGNPASSRLVMNAVSDNTIPRTSDFWRSRNIVSGEYTTSTTVDNSTLPRYRLHLPQRLRVRSPQHTTLRNDRRGVLGWSHIERWIADPHIVRRQLLPSVMRHFLRRALLNRNRISGRSLHIDRGPGSRAIERNSVLFS